MRLVSYANLAIRAVTLVLRFALVFYLAHFLGLDATGIYGLALGAVGIVPALIGWGLNYFVAREVVGLEPRSAVLILRDRLLVTLVSLSGATVVAVIVALLVGLPIDRFAIMIAALVWLETLCSDVHVALIGMSRPVLANALMFLRTASWVLPVVLLGLLVPQTRTLETVFALWICGSLATAIVLLVLLRRLAIDPSTVRSVDYVWLRERLSRSWYIYISDLGLVGFVYIDRYVVGYVLGLTDTGIYTFYWSLTNALQTLIATAVVQVALPHLVTQFRRSIGDWRAALRQEITRVFAMSGVLSVSMFAAGVAGIHFGYFAPHEHALLLFGLLLAASVVRSCSDVLNVGLSTIGRDRFYAFINVLGIPISIAFTYAFVVPFGLIGAGIGAVTAGLCLVLIRAVFLVRVSGALVREGRP